MDSCPRNEKSSVGRGDGAAVAGPRPAQLMRLPAAPLMGVNNNSLDSQNSSSGSNRTNSSASRNSVSVVVVHACPEVTGAAVPAVAGKALHMKWGSGSGSHIDCFPVLTEPARCSANVVTVADEDAVAVNSSSGQRGGTTTISFLTSSSTVPRSRSPGPPSEDPKDNTKAPVVPAAPVVAVAEASSLPMRDTLSVVCSSSKAHLAFTRRKGSSSLLSASRVGAPTAWTIRDGPSGQQTSIIAKDSAAALQPHISYHQWHVSSGGSDDGTSSDVAVLEGRVGGTVNPRLQNTSSRAGLSASGDGRTQCHASSTLKALDILAVGDCEDEEDGVREGAIFVGGSSLFELSPRRLSGHSSDSNTRGNAGAPRGRIPHSQSQLSLSCALLPQTVPLQSALSTTPKGPITSSSAAGQRGLLTLFAGRRSVPSRATEAPADHNGDNEESAAATACTGLRLSGDTRMRIMSSFPAAFPAELGGVMGTKHLSGRLHAQSGAPTSNPQLGETGRELQQHDGTSAPTTFSPRTATVSSRTARASSPDGVGAVIRVKSAAAVETKLAASKYTTQHRAILVPPAPAAPDSCIHPHLSASSFHSASLESEAGRLLCSSEPMTGPTASAASMTQLPSRSATALPHALVPAALQTPLAYQCSPHLPTKTAFSISSASLASPLLLGREAAANTPTAGASPPLSRPPRSPCHLADTAASSAPAVSDIALVQLPALADTASSSPVSSSSGGGNRALLIAAGRRRPLDALTLPIKSSSLPLRVTPGDWRSVLSAGTSRSRAGPVGMHRTSLSSSAPTEASDVHITTRLGQRPCGVNGDVVSTPGLLQRARVFPSVPPPSLTAALQLSMGSTSGISCLASYVSRPTTANTHEFHSCADGLLGDAGGTIPAHHFMSASPLTFGASTTPKHLLHASTSEAAVTATTAESVGSSADVFSGAVAEVVVANHRQDESSAHHNLTASTETRRAARNPAQICDTVSSPSSGQGNSTGGRSGNRDQSSGTGRSSSGPTTPGHVVATDSTEYLDVISVMEPPACQPIAYLSAGEKRALRRHYHNRLEQPQEVGRQTSSHTAQSCSGSDAGRPQLTSLAPMTVSAKDVLLNTPTSAYLCSNSASATSSQRGVMYRGEDSVKPRRTSRMSSRTAVARLVAGLRRTVKSGISSMVRSSRRADISTDSGATDIMMGAALRGEATKTIPCSDNSTSTNSPLLTRGGTREGAPTWSFSLVNQRSFGVPQTTAHMVPPEPNAGAVVAAMALPLQLSYSPSSLSQSSTVLMPVPIPTDVSSTVCGGSDAGADVALDGSAAVRDNACPLGAPPISAERQRQRQRAAPTLDNSGLRAEAVAWSEGEWVVIADKEASTASCSCKIEGGTSAAAEALVSTAEVALPLSVEHEVHNAQSSSRLPIAPSVPSYAGSSSQTLFRSCEAVVLPSVVPLHVSCIAKSHGSSRSRGSSRNSSRGGPLLAALATARSLTKRRNLLKGSRCSLLRDAGSRASPANRADDTPNTTRAPTRVGFLPLPSSASLAAKVGIAAVPSEVRGADDNDANSSCSNPLHLPPLNATTASSSHSNHRGAAAAASNTQQQQRKSSSGSLPTLRSTFVCGVPDERMRQACTLQCGHQKLCSSGDPGTATNSVDASRSSSSQTSSRHPQTGGGRCYTSATGKATEARAVEPLYAGQGREVYDVFQSGVGVVVANDATAAPLPLLARSLAFAAPLPGVGRYDTSGSCSTTPRSTIAHAASATPFFHSVLGDDDGGRHTAEAASSMFRDVERAVWRCHNSASVGSDDPRTPRHKWVSHATAASGSSTSTPDWQLRRRSFTSGPLLSHTSAANMIDLSAPLTTAPVASSSASAISASGFSSAATALVTCSTPPRVRYAPPFPSSVAVAPQGALNSVSTLAAAAEGNIFQATPLSRRSFVSVLSGSTPSPPDAADDKDKISSALPVPDVLTCPTCTKTVSMFRPGSSQVSRWASKLRVMDSSVTSLSMTTTTTESAPSPSLRTAQRSGNFSDVAAEDSSSLSPVPKYASTATSTADSARSLALASRLLRSSLQLNRPAADRDDPLSGIASRQQLNVGNHDQPPHHSFHFAAVALPQALQLRNLLRPAAARQPPFTSVLATPSAITASLYTGNLAGVSGDDGSFENGAVHDPAMVAAKRGTACGAFLSSSAALPSLKSLHTGSNGSGSPELDHPPPEHTGNFGGGKLDVSATPSPVMELSLSILSSSSSTDSTEPERRSSRSSGGNIGVSEGAASRASIATTTGSSVSAVDSGDDDGSTSANSATPLPTAMVAPGANYSPPPLSCDAAPALFHLSSLFLFHQLNGSLTSGGIPALMLDDNEPRSPLKPPPQPRSETGVPWPTGLCAATGRGTPVSQQQQKQRPSALPIPAPPDTLVRTSGALPPAGATAFIPSPLPAPTLRCGVHSIVGRTMPGGAYSVPCGGNGGAAGTGASCSKTTSHDGPDISSTTEVGMSPSGAAWVSGNVLLSHHAPSLSPCPSQSPQLLGAKCDLETALLSCAASGSDAGGASGSLVGSPSVRRSSEFPSGTLGSLLYIPPELRCGPQWRHLKQHLGGPNNASPLSSPATTPRHSDRRSSHKPMAPSFSPLPAVLAAVQGVDTDAKPTTHTSSLRPSSERPLSPTAAAVVAGRRCAGDGVITDSTEEQRFSRLFQVNSDYKTLVSQRMNTQPLNNDVNEFSIVSTVSNATVTTALPEWPSKNNTGNSAMTPRNSSAHESSARPTTTAAAGAAVGARLSYTRRANALHGSQWDGANRNTIAATATAHVSLPPRVLPHPPHERHSAEVNEPVDDGRLLGAPARVIQRSAGIDEGSSHAGSSGGGVDNDDDGGTETADHVSGV
ncbi:hypothetical protein, conserved [Leishmania shawi]|uniref:Uncharacterized protein n=1 Tax=Leishmania shawi TaxID=5680 RepID=A0ABR3EEE0_9TRYP